MQQLSIYGPIAGPEGYSEVTRGFALALAKLGVSVKLEPFASWGPWKVRLPQEQQELLAELQRTTLYPQKEPIPHVQVCLPQQVRAEDCFWNLNYTMFEADRIPSFWVDALAKIDRVLVPNSFCFRIFEESGVPAGKLRIVPLGFDPQIFNTEVAPLPLEVRDRPVESYPVRFISVLEITNRKNFAGLLATYCAVADNLGKDNCCLILRAGNYSNYLPLAVHVQRIVRDLHKNGAAKHLEYPILLYPPLLPSDSMGAFLASGTHYLSLSLAEGWDLNCLNAMATGVPVIVPFHSGYQTYCDHSNACLLPIAKKIPAAQQPPTGYLYAGANWFAPDNLESIKIITQYVREPKLAALRAHKAALSARLNYTWKSCAQKLLQVCES